MTTQMVRNWTGADRAAFLKAPVRFQHGLADTGVFSDLALASLLETHPDDLTDVNLNEFGADGMAQVRTGTRGGLDGQTLLQAAREGRVWINLRKVGCRDPRIAPLVDQAMAELKAANPGFKPVTVYANLLLSGPQTRVPYHADTPGVCLFHLVGAKRIWIYPNHGRTLPDEAMEAVALREGTEDLPYRPDFDEDAEVFDLAPGQAVVWPFNAPHRVDNLGTFNVSLSVEFMTWEGRLRHGVYYANGTLRRRFGLSPAPLARTSGMGRLARWGLTGLFKRLGVNTSREAVFKADFDMALGTRDSVQDRAAA